MKRILLLAALAASPAHAQTCRPFDEMREYLAECCGETVGIVMFAEDNSYVIFRNPESQSWSIAEFRDGRACLRMVGQGFSFPPRVPEGQDG